MMRYFCTLVLMLSALSCRERYDAVYEVPDTGFLVVEGYINSAGVTKISLSRTTPLTERGLLPELNAVLLIEGEDNSQFPVLEKDSGKYESESLQLANSTRYRLKIKTQSEKEYISEFQSPMQTPEIDSISWQRENGGVQIYINSKASASQSAYYKWEYEEAWEYRAHYPTTLGIKSIPQPNAPPRLEIYLRDSSSFSFDSSIRYCWLDRMSTGIHIGTTDKLTENRLFVPIIYYPQNSLELNWLYSVKIKQVSISRDAYQFYEKMKKNTEMLGSVFDPLPTDIQGNIQCTSNSSEPVIGYIDVTTQKEKRVFISVDELDGWFYDSKCVVPDTVVTNDQAGLEYMRLKFLEPIAVYKSDDHGKVLSVYIAPQRCVDCTLYGSNIKPSFWPW